MLYRDIAWPAHWVLALALFTALAVGCAGESDATTATGAAQAVRGRIVEVSSPSLLELESLTIRDESGETYILNMGGEAGGVALGRFTPSHLREHMVSGQVVVVTYHDEGGRLMLDAISD